MTSVVPTRGSVGVTECRPHFTIESRPPAQQLGDVGLHDLRSGHPGQVPGQIYAGNAE